MPSVASTVNAHNYAVPASNLEVLLDAETIAHRVRELAAQISADYRGRPLRLVGMP